MNSPHELAQTVRECLDLGLQSWRTTRVASRFLTAFDSLDELVALAEAGERAREALRDYWVAVYVELWDDEQEAKVRDALGEGS